MLGLFGKKKPKTALDELIYALYGNPPPPKTARLDEAIQIACDELLSNLVSKQEVTKLATELNSGPVPYSTHDLAVSVALNFFKQPERMKQLSVVQMLARLKVSEWVQQRKVVTLLAASFEEVLYKRYKP
jgi:hypothetical protein